MPVKLPACIGVRVTATAVCNPVRVAVVASGLPDPEIFVGIAALGLTVTGFSGLISVLGRRSSGHWTEAERFQLSELIVVSLAVTFASFIPILVGMVLAAETALPAACGLVAFFHLVVLVRGAYMNFRDGTSDAKMPSSVVAFMLVGGCLLIIAALLASFGFVGGAAFFVVSNLLWQLMVAAIHFVAFFNRTGTADI